MAQAVSRSIFRPAFTIMSGRVIGFAATFAIPIVLVRIFSQAEFGTYKQIFLIFGTLFTIGQIGMAESLYYFVPSAGKRGGGYVLNAVSVLAVAGVVLLALLWLNAGSIAGWMNNPELATYLPYLGVFLLMMLMSVVLEITMISHKHHRFAFGAYAASDAGRAALLVLPALLLHSLIALMVGAIVFAVFRLAAAALYLRKQYTGELVFDTARWKRHLTYALPFALAVSIQMAQAQFDKYFVSGWFDAATFAIYAVGCLQMPLAGFLISSTGSVMMVRMREILDKGDTSEALGIWRDTTRKLILIFAGLAGVLTVSAHAIIVTLYTAAYTSSVPIFEICSIGIVFAALMIDSLMRVYAQTKFLVALNLVSLGVLAGTVVFLVNLLGLIGVVCAALVAGFAERLLGLWWSKRVMQCTIKEILPWKSLAGSIGIALAAAVPALAVRAYVELPVVAKLFLIPTVYLAVYLVLAWRYGSMRQNEKAAILQVLRSSRRYLPRFESGLRWGPADSTVANLPDRGVWPATERLRRRDQSSVRGGRRVVLRLLYPSSRRLWYALDISRGRAKAIKPSDGIEVLKCNSASVAAVPRSSRTGALRNLRRLMRGEAQLWIAREGEAAVASVWVFRGRTPVVAAPGGWLSLPPGHVCLEDAVTSPEYRGRGIAPGLWAKVAENLASEGVQTVLLQIDDHNQSAIRAAEKAGFHPLATMELERSWLRAHVRISGWGGANAPEFLVEQLARRRLAG